MDFSLCDFDCIVHDGLTVCVQRNLLTVNSDENKITDVSGEGKLAYSLDRKKKCRQMYTLRVSWEQ